MAKSKSGGTRALLRGRVGSDVYSVGKDGMGKRQQVVRSLAEVVANPRTENQMFGRMIMSTVMQAVSAFSPIIDHSFDGVAKGQPSISDFIRRNYALVKADALAHPSSNNKFDLNKYQEKGIKCGNWQISAGSAVVPALISLNSSAIFIKLSETTKTIADLKAALGSALNGYLTLVGLDYTKGLKYTRAKYVSTLADNTEISAANVGSLFSFEGNAIPTVTLTSLGDYNAICIDLWNLEGCTNAGIIVTVPSANGWEHSTCKLDGEGVEEWTADVALPTYPTGSEQYLNGGEI